MRWLVALGCFCFSCSASEGSGSPDATSQGGSSGAAGEAGGGGSGTEPASRCPAGPYEASPLPPDLSTEMVCDGMTFTEGAVWFAERGTLYFSDFSMSAASNFNGRIMQHTPGGGCEEFIADTGTNGLAIAPDGNLLGCRHLDRTLSVFDITTLTPSVLAADFEGNSFNSPNDTAVRSDGNLYFTDPSYQLGNRTQERPVSVYRRDPSGSLSVIDEPNANPNGITLSPDETLLYVATLGGGGSQITVYDVHAEGAVSNPRSFLGTGSDGMVVDCAGNLYITQGGVRVYTPAGDLIDTINAPGATNVAFGGPEQKTLYITARSTLLAIELNIPGLPY